MALNVCTPTTLAGDILGVIIQVYLQTGVS